MVTHSATSHAVVTDLDHGGRWTALRLGGRDWLWQRADPARGTVVPGDDFVDAGGLEECVPTVRGTPDHGAAWSRRWRRDGDRDVVECPDFVLHRRIHDTGELVHADYELTADPGYRFVWAAHALLDLGVGAQVDLPLGAPARVYGGGAPELGSWPRPLDLDLGEFGPDDGTAIGVVVTDTDSVVVRDGADQLRFELTAPADVPTSVALWRNLGGFPADRPYRSIGVEPMLGRVFELAEAGPGDAAETGPDGSLRWRMTVTAGTDAR
jgi:hypothetical protein